ncbi:MAG: endonuclease/exonuclease/phosphatase family protein [Planctomycetaceae bacterium]
MRLVTWNLRNGVGRPLWPRLQAELQADIGFLQESDAAPNGANVIWRKVPEASWGSAVVTSLGRIRSIELPGYEGWVVGGEVELSGRGLSVFSVHAPSSTKVVPREPYATEVVKIVELIRDAVRPENDLIIGGDFNVTLGERHPSESLHTTSSDRLALKAIAAVGLISCWTAAHPGTPLAQTLRWSGDRSPGKGTPYHCDGLLVPASWSRRITCSIHTDDCFRVSDHNPVSAVV